MRRLELDTFLRQCSIELSAEYKRITSRAREDPGTAGDETECAWAEALKKWLPPYYPVVTKGRVVSHDGEASPQVDLLVLSPAYPPSLMAKKTYLASGVLAAFECKTTLRSRDLKKFYSNCSQIKRLCATTEGTVFGELFAPIYCGCLALSSQVRPSAHSACVKLDRSIVRHPREMPDVLCIADLEIILATKSNIVFDRAWFEVDAQGRTRPPPMTEPVWTGYYPVKDPGRPHVPIGLLLQSLYYWLGWKDRHVREMHNFFEDTGMRVDTGADVRMWPYSIYSDAVQGEFKRQARLTNGVRWSEWGVAYF